LISRIRCANLNISCASKPEFERKRQANDERPQPVENDRCRSVRATHQNSILNYSEIIRNPFLHHPAISVTSCWKLSVSTCNNPWNQCSIYGQKNYLCTSFSIYRMPGSSNKYAHRAL